MLKSATRDHFHGAHNHKKSSEQIVGESEGNAGTLNFGRRIQRIAFCYVSEVLARHARVATTSDRLTTLTQHHSQGI